jgi:hypothetical protein
MGMAGRDVGPQERSLVDDPDPDDGDDQQAG